MIRTRAQKQALVTSLTEKLRAATTIYVTDFTGLNVARMAELRRRLRKAGVEFVIVKNTLAHRASQAAAVAGLEPHLTGPTGLVLAGADPVAAAKVLNDFAKEHTRPTVRAGLLDGRAITADAVKRLAALPSREQLLAQLAGGLQAPLANFLGALNGLLYSVVGALEALRARRGGAA